MKIKLLGFCNWNYTYNNKIIRKNIHTEMITWKYFKKSYIVTETEKNKQKEKRFSLMCTKEH